MLSKRASFGWPSLAALLVASVALPRVASAQAPTAAPPPPPPAATAPPPGSQQPPPSWPPPPPTAGPQGMPPAQPLPPPQALPPAQPVLVGGESRAGMQQVDAPVRSLVITGSSILGGTYLLNAMVAGTVLYQDRQGDEDEWAPLLLPALGPFIAMGTVNDGNVGTGTFLLFDGITQLAGLGILIGGLVSTEKRWVRVAESLPSVQVGDHSVQVGWKF